jgi:hypothetical protein
MNLLEKIRDARTKAPVMDGNTVALVIKHADELEAMPITQTQIAYAIGCSKSLISIGLAAAKELKNEL